MPVDASGFTAALRAVPAPVAVATTLDANGVSWGFTATSFSSLSLDPPLILICLGKAASTHTAFASAAHLMINILAEDQGHIARRFAASGSDRFAAGDMRPCELGLPGLPAAAVRLACELREVIDGGDHSILVCGVEATYVGTALPLVYCSRAFTRPEPLGSPAQAR